MFRARHACAAALLLALSGQAGSAAVLKLVCENPRQEYVATFDSEANTFVVSSGGDPTAYRVTAARRSEDGLVVRGRTVNGGPDFEAFFGEAPAIAYGSDQVDHCRHV